MHKAPASQGLVSRGAAGAGTRRGHAAPMRGAGDAEATRPTMQELLKTHGTMAFCVVGIVGTLMVYAVFQERIMTMPYGEEGAHFSASLFIVLINRCITCTVAAGTTVVKGDSLKPAAPLYCYVLVSLSNVIATTCQYEALKYVSFPVQTLAKCAKMIPVMIWGLLMLGKKYKARDYVLTVVVTIGCAVFMGTGATKSRRAKAGGSDSLYGLLLMCGYLGFDGFTSTFQEKLFKNYTMSTHNQILYVTASSSCFALFGLLTANQLFPAIAFVTTYPQCLREMMLLSVAATLSQNFISFTVKRFGALFFATVMTTRQFLSILTSCLLFGTALTSGQWVGTALVFAALYAKSFTGGKRPSSQPSGASDAAPATLDGKGGGP